MKTQSFGTLRLRMWVFVIRVLPGNLAYWLPQPKPFEPRAIDQASARKEIEDLVGQLAPDAIDEATGHVMDRLISVWADAWVAGLTVDFQRHGLGSARSSMIADALAARQAVLSEHLLRRRDELIISHRAAVDALAGAAVRPSVPHQYDPKDPATASAEVIP